MCVSVIVVHYLHTCTTVGGSKDKQKIFISDGLTETDTLLQEALESNATDDSLLQKITEKYFVELSSLSEDLTRQRSDFNLIYMVFGCLSLWALLVAFFLFVRNAWPCNALQLLLSLGTLAHTLSLASTSFIEEEHQTWYFLWTTLLLLCLRERWRRKAVVRSYVLDVKTCSLLLLCTLHRFLRKLNQTGDKWAHLPDWDDSLRSNQLLLVLVFILSKYVFRMEICFYMTILQSFCLVTYLQQ